MFPIIDGVPHKKGAKWTMFKREYGVSVAHGNMGVMVKSYRLKKAAQEKKASVDYNSKMKEVVSEYLEDAVRTVQRRVFGSVRAESSAMGGGDNWKFVLWEERDDGSLYKLEVSFEFSRGKVRCLVKSNGELTHIQNAVYQAL